MTTGPHSPRARSGPSWRFLAEVLALAALGVSAVSGCGATPVAGSGARPSTPVIRASLATSIETSAGSWATVAMGHLDQPLNTFWQLLFRPPGAALWSDRASALAVATNGGLVVATHSGRSLAIGIRPTNHLDYSPLIVTSDARSWLPAGPIGALADEPDALALAAGGEAMALVSDGRVTRVLASPGGLASWRQIATEDGLATSAAGRSCGLVSLLAVGYAAGQGLIGAGCSRDGIVGIFASRRSAWRLVGPRLPQSLRNSSAEVLGLQTTTRGLCALVGVTVRRSTKVVAACTSGNGLKWRVSPALSLAGPQHVVSFGPAGDLGLFVMISGSAHRDILAVLGEPDVSWRTLPSPPARTAVVVFGPAGRLDALAVDGTSFTDWLLAGGDRWKKVQEFHVAIQFGSSG